MATEPHRKGAPSWVRYSGIVIILASLLALFGNFFAIAVFPEVLVPGTWDVVIVGNLILSYVILGIIGAVTIYVYTRIPLPGSGRWGSF